MLDLIRYHLHANDEEQSKIESGAALDVNQRYADNQKLFAHQFPNLATALNRFTPTKTSIFINGLSQLNLVEVQSGQVFYPKDISRAIQSQVEHFEVNSSLFNYDEFRKASPSKVDPTLEILKRDAQKIKQQAQSGEVNTLAIMGLGAAHHLLPLIKSVGAGCVIVYEPDFHHLHASLYTGEWQTLCDILNAHNTLIFLQVGKDGSHLFDDLAELSQNVDVGNVLLFRHYHTDTFDRLWRFTRGYQEPSGEEREMHSTPRKFAYGYDLNSCQPVPASDLFAQNKEAFDEFYPEIGKVIGAYKPKVWQPVLLGNTEKANTQGVDHSQGSEVTLVNIYSGSVFSVSPCQDAKDFVQQYSQYPNQETVYMGYNSGKLNHFFFNQLYTECGGVLDEIQDQQMQLPSKVDVLIIFGLGNGYILNELLSNFDIGALLLNEPNTDLFVTSLYSARWHDLLLQTREREKHLYLNLGALDASLISDYTRQFNLVGNHLITRSYLLQGYFDERYKPKIRELQNTLTTLFSISSNFDHAYYSMGHFQASKALGCKFLKHKASDVKNAFDTPVFVVGNGPSVDYCIDELRALQNQVIIVSCGTALKTLHSNGIVPDFHAEIEAYRANFDWISQVDDKEYLKQVTLISADGIHPDNINKFKSTRLALKAGELASTLMLTLCEDDKFKHLTFAYPTVANFAVNFFAEAGAKEIYLFGIDLGYKDPNHNHSKSSAYYVDGKARFEHTLDTQSGMTVQGNFSPYVFTKFEFRLAKTMIESCLGNFKLDCFNTADGALIEGSLPLNVDHILVMSDEETKRQCLELFERQFEFIPDYFDNRLQSKFPKHLVVEILKAHIDGLPNKFESSAAIFDFIDGTIEAFKKIPTSGWFFHLYISPTSKCFMAALAKVASQADEKRLLFQSNHLITHYRKFLHRILDTLEKPQHCFDISVSSPEIREAMLIEKREVPVLYCCDSRFDSALRDAMKHAQLSELQYQFIDEGSIESGSLAIDAPSIFCIETIEHWKSIHSTFADSLNQIAVMTSDETVFNSIFTEQQNSSGRLLKGVMLFESESLFWSDSHADEFVTGKLGSLTPTQFMQEVAKRFAALDDFDAVILKPRYAIVNFAKIASHRDEHPANLARVKSRIEFVNQLDAVKLNFKQYIGLATKSENIEREINGGGMMDALQNRSHLMTRPFTHYEYLSHGYFTGEYEKQVQYIQELTQSV